jgi:hypothetical protein
MAIPDTASFQLENDSKFLSILMPNRGRTKFLRGAILLFLFIGAMGCLIVARRVWSEFHARHSWPVAQGHVTAVNLRSYRGPSARDHVDHYFVEYEVRFAVPAEQCLTGTIFVVDKELSSCVGIARTRSTNSQALANAWLERHQFNAAVEVLHDPNGPGVKIVGEPSSLVYPWREIFGMSGWTIFFLISLIVAQRRLQYLETLPENYDASPRTQSQPPGGDDLIDLKLPH